MRQKRQKQPKSARPRIYLLDELRGFAILCMVVHHAFFLDVGDVLQLSWGYRGVLTLCVPCSLSLGAVYSGYPAFAPACPVIRYAEAQWCWAAVW